MSNFSEILKQRSGYAEFEQREKEYEERQKNYVNRFWLPPEGNTKIIFLDDNPPILEEHQLKINGDWRHWYTCLRVIGEACPICDILQDQPYTVGYYTIIDTAEWTDRKGQKHVNERKLLAVKFKALQMLKRLSAKRGSLVGCVFDVYRSSKDAFNTGDVFDYEGKLEPEQIKRLNPDAEPYDYAKILEPKSPAELKKLLQGNAERASNEFAEFDRDEGDIEF